MKAAMLSLVTALYLISSPAEAQKKGDGLKLKSTRVVKTKDGKKIYPSPKMLAAALRLLGELDKTKVDADFKKKFALAKLNLRMRAPGTKSTRTKVLEGGKSIVCTFESAADKTKSVGAKIAVNAKEDAYESSDGLDYVGKDDEGKDLKYSYAFMLGLVEGENGKVALDVMFNEGLVVEDEVGSFSCEIPDRNETFCEEPIEEDGKLVGRFSCKRE